MKWITLVGLLASWALWLVARFGGMDHLSGWAFVLVYASVSLGFLFSTGLSGLLRDIARFLGLGFLMLSLGELGWLTLFAASDGGGGGNVILPNIPYYAATTCFVVAAYRLFQQGGMIFGFSRGLFWGALITAFVIVVGQLAIGWNSGAVSLGLLFDSLNNLFGAFVPLLLIGIAYLTAGGTWSRWMIPLAAGFGFRLLADLYYTVTASTYAYGSPADWLWLVGTTTIGLLLMSEGHREQQVAVSAD